MLVGFGSSSGAVPCAGEELDSAFGPHILFEQAGCGPVGVVASSKPESHLTVVAAETTRRRRATQSSQKALVSRALQGTNLCPLDTMAME